MENIKTLTVFNTCTSKHEVVEVSQEVYDEFRRGEWRISKNDDKHNANETPFSALVGGGENAFENFDEFVDPEKLPDNEVLRNEDRRLARIMLCELSETKRRRFIMHYFDRLTTKEIADLEGVSEYSVKESIKKARCEIKLFLKKISK